MFQLIRHYRLPTLAILVAFQISSCDNVVRCIVDDHPAFNLDNLVTPVLNQEYSASIGAHIVNDPLDDRYDYEWTLTGSLPPGISYTAKDRDLLFSGTATSLGTYKYTVEVRARTPVDWYNPDDSDAAKLCRETESSRLEMVVEPL